MTENVCQVQPKSYQSNGEDGILVGLATGRGPGFVQPFMDNLGLDLQSLIMVNIF